MPTKNEIKRIQSLKQKKKRQQQGVFVAEGEKLVRHLLDLGLESEMLFALKGVDIIETEAVSTNEMKQLSLLKTPSSVIGVFKQPIFETSPFQGEIVLVLDAIRDPGNLGTMLRLCDWFGVKQVICTPDCVDVFNEKVVQASMGSIANIPCFYLEVDEVIDQALTAGFTLMATTMEGKSIYQNEFPAKTAMVIGNEGQGISNALLEASTSRVSIPAHADAKAESLNAAMATAVLLSEYFRTNI